MSKPPSSPASTLAQIAAVTIKAREEAGLIRSLHDTGGPEALAAALKRVRDKARAEERGRIIGRLGPGPHGQRTRPRELS